MTAARKRQPELTAHTSSRQQFNERFFVGRNIEWFDAAGVFQIDNNKRATITIREYGYAEHWSGYTVEIIHKDTGKIDSMVFKFSAYLSSKDRIDSRNDVKTNFHAWRNQGTFEWYICEPSDAAVRNMADRIFNYVEQWR